MLADLRLWSRLRRMVAAAVAVGAIGGLLLAASMVSSTPGLGAPWWAFATVGAGGILVGLLVAGYLEAPIGAEATMCDLRWPVLGLVGLYLAGDARALAPALSAEVRPVVALAALAMLVWALTERMRGERRSLAAARRRDAGLGGAGGGTVVGRARDAGRATDAGRTDAVRTDAVRTDAVRTRAGRSRHAGLTAHPGLTGDADLSADGETCTSCRPLFPTRTRYSGGTTP